MHDEETCDRTWRASVVLLQHRQHSDGRALGRLIRMLEQLERLDYHLVVVDLAEPGEWVHRVGERLVHAGAGTGQARLAALERGVEVVEQLGIGTDLWLLASDVLLSEAATVPDLVGETAVKLAMEHDAVVGPLYDLGGVCRIDGLELDSWIDTGLMLVPDAVLGPMRPLGSGLEPAAVVVQRLEDSGSSPFVEGAPVDGRLRQFLLDRLTTSHRSAEPVVEPAPMASALDSSTLGRFTAEVMELLGEHLLAARLRHAGVPCYDSGFARRLASEPALRRCFEADPQAWQWLESVRCGERPASRYHLEAVKVPEVIIHGDSAPVEISGWVLATPPVDAVVIQVTDGSRLVVPCSTPRSDVLRAYPQYETLHCGFELRTDLAHLSPGRYELRLEIDELEVATTIAEVVVEPRLDFRLHGVEVEGFVAADCSVSVVLDGEVRSSRPLDRIEVEWDVQPGEVPLSLAETSDRHCSLHRYRVRARGVAGTWRIRFTDADGARYTWCRDPEAVGDDGMLRTQLELPRSSGDIASNISGDGPGALDADDPVERR